MLFEVFGTNELSKDEYLSIYMPSSNSCDALGYRERFLSSSDVSDRISQIESAIQKLTNELRILEKFDDKLVGARSWMDVRSR